MMADARLSDNERAAFVDLLTRLDPSGPPQPSRRSFGRRMVPPAIAVAARRTRRSAAWHLSRRYGP